MCRQSFAAAVTAVDGSLSPLRANECEQENEELTLSNPVIL